jgi:parallel beta-helix repeat protein
VPATAIFVSSSTGSDGAAGTRSAPLRTVTSAVAKAVAGQTIVVRGGTYHESVTVPAAKSGLAIQAYPNEAVWFDGAVSVSTWTQSGSHWTHAGWTAQFSHTSSFTSGVDRADFINPSYPMAAWPDQVYFSGRALAQVGSAAGVTDGTFYVDYAAHSLVVGSNPVGQPVQASDLEQAFVVQATGVLLQGFGVRHYATPLPDLGTVRIIGGSDVVRNLVITDNATQGISFRNPNNLADHITSSGNGMTGIHGNTADGLRIVNSVSDSNNAQHFNASPSAAGIKITRTRGLRISGNEVSGNIATTGIWMDESVVGLIVTGNTVADNGSVGIQTELSDTGTIADNTVTGGARGIYVSDSGNMKIFNNYFANNTLGSVFLAQDSRREANAGDAGHDPRQPIPDATCPWLTRNVVVANNVFAGYAAGGQYQFYVLDRQTNIAADRMNITIAGNVFHARTATSQPHLVGWGGADNHTISYFDTTAALTAKNASWLNTVPGSTLSSEAVAVAVPTDVASAIGQPAGVRHSGTF